MRAATQRWLFLLKRFPNNTLGIQGDFYEYSSIA